MPSPKAPADPFDSRLVRKLADILNDTGLSEIEVERAGLKIRVARQVHATAMVAAPAVLPTPLPAPVAAAAPAPAAPAEVDGEIVKSPMVGTVYLQPQPGADPFVRVGDMVEAGQTLILIEAMKTMNPIPAPRAGRLRELRVADGQPVEFGEPLAVIE